MNSSLCATQTKLYKNMIYFEQKYYKYWQVSFAIYLSIEAGELMKGNGGKGGKGGEKVDLILQLVLWEKRTSLVEMSWILNQEGKLPVTDIVWSFLNEMSHKGKKISNSITICIFCGDVGCFSNDMWAFNWVQSFLWIESSTRFYTPIVCIDCIMWISLLY